MTDDTPRLDQLGDALLAATQADLTSQTRKRPWSRTTLAAVVVAAVAIPGAAIAGNAIFSEEDVAASLPAGTLMLAGTEPRCTVVKDQVEYRCTLARAPQGEIAPGAFKGTVEPTVGPDKHVNGGCRALDADGLTWNCYLGQAAVDQKIIGPDFLGEYAPSPGVG